ncbi:ATP-binding protein [Mycobacterium riyadhense]|uniref:ATP-binding protein n=1 Tax=Mycobacterium riyadhense TaxID=486698 RepID=UPI0019599091|nr:ATP-binding protein [Mycobacterium riyadhense]
MAEKRSQASQLVDMALADYRLGVSDDGQPYGTYPDAPHVALPLRGGKLGLRSALARTYFGRFDAAPSSQALSDACAVIEGYAAQEKPRTLHLRVAEHGGAVYIDMADRTDRVIEISRGTWHVANTAPVVFRRTELTAGMAETMDPVSGGDVDILWRHVNVAPEDQPVLLAVLVSALIQPDAPHVILALLAEHGSAKSTTAKRLVSLVDPSIAPLRMPPRDVDQWVTAANGSWVVAVDNVSTVPPWWSDALCRAATGDALTKRRLYTDADLAVLKFRRVVILNGIDLGGLAGDLSDRLALVELGRITDTARRPEAALEKEWRRDYPVILGGLLDLAAEVHERLQTITVAGGLPRMADFGRVLACVDQLHGSNGMRRYRGRATRLAADSLASDSFVAELVAHRYRAEALTSRQILGELTPADKGWRRPRDWPRNARIVTTQLTRHAPALRAQGWAVEHDGGRTEDGITRWTITPPEKGCKSSPSDPSDPSPQVSGQKSDGSETGQWVTDGSDGSDTGQANPSNPSEISALTSEDGSTGQTGQDYGQSLDGALFGQPTTNGQPRYCACGNTLSSPEALAASKCRPCRDRAMAGYDR